MQRAGGVVGRDRGLERDHHRPGVEPGLHLHQAHAGAGVAGQQRALDRRRAAPARQQRGVDVPAAQARDAQHGPRQDHAVGDHDHQVRLERRELRPRLGRLEVPGLEHRHVALLRQHLDRAGHQLAAAAGRPVGLGVDAHHLMAAAQRGLQAGHGEVGRAGENDALGLQAGQLRWKASLRSQRDRASAGPRSRAERAPTSAPHHCRSDRGRTSRPPRHCRSALCARPRNRKSQRRRIQAAAAPGAIGAASHQSVCSRASLRLSRACFSRRLRTCSRLKADR